MNGWIQMGHGYLGSGSDIPRSHNWTQLSSLLVLGYFYCNSVEQRNSCIMKREKRVLYSELQWGWRQAGKPFTIIRIHVVQLCLHATTQGPLDCTEAFLFKGKFSRIPPFLLIFTVHASAMPERSVHQHSGLLFFFTLLPTQTPAFPLAISVFLFHYSFSPFFLFHQLYQ